MWQSRSTTNRTVTLLGRVNIALILVVLIVMVLVFLYLAGIDTRRNATRLKDVQAITTALHQYVAEHNGNLPDGLDSRERQIGMASSGCFLSTAQCSIVQDTDCIDLNSSLRPYLKDLPADPATGSSSLTHYAVRIERGGGFLVIACDYSE